MGWNPFKRPERQEAGALASARHVFVNRQDHPIYISVEPWPDCFELEPGERLTLIVAQGGDGSAEVEFLNDREMVIFPASIEVDYQIDGEPAAERSWQFKHR